MSMKSMRDLCLDLSTLPQFVESTTKRPEPEEEPENVWLFLGVQQPSNNFHCVRQLRQTRVGLLI